MRTSYDVIVVGGGHAGCEAAAAAARAGASVALLTFDRATVGAMSCNPAIGGLGKGHLVREVDALDGLIGRAADAAAIHYRMLNSSKGAAVQGPRIQADRRRYRAVIHQMLDAQAGLAIVEGEASELILSDDAIAGIALADGRELAARAVVLATGTFLGGKLFRGDEREAGGRIGERAATSLGMQLRDLGLPIARLKTGTPPRLDGRTIDWARLETQPSDADGWTMSPLTPARILPQLACAITRTNDRTHQIIRDGLGRSPLFSGAIEGRGPRYCPSIEDKVLRFGDRDGHQIFLEPEGLDDALVYPNGISTSLPTDVQLAMVRSMVGLEQVEIVVPGYAVEYDHVDPRALGATLEVRLGGKMGPTSGNPLDLRVEVAAIHLDMKQEWPQDDNKALSVEVGDAVRLHCQGVDIIVNTRRGQVLSPQVFSKLGLDPTQMRLLVVKSIHHFYGAFAPFAAEVIYTSAPGAVAPKFEGIPYTRVDLNKYPWVDDPFAAI